MPLETRPDDVPSYFQLPEASFGDQLLDTVSLWRRLELSGCTAAHHSNTCSAECLLEPGWASSQPSPEGDAGFVGLMLASSLERSHQREAAIGALERALGRRPLDARVRLALAKLQFRSSRKEEALGTLQALLDDTRAQQSVDALPPATAPALAHCSPAVRADAWYLAGWCHIHADNHTAAYGLWTEGAALLPGDGRLARQARKHATWAGMAGDSCAPTASPLLGRGGCVTAASQLQGYPLPPGASDPAQRLFHSSQGPTLAFTSTLPLLTRSECAAVVAAAEAHISAAHSGAWPTVRSSSVPTTDLAVEDVPALVPWLRALCASRLLPLLAQAFPLLADGTPPSPTRMRLHDAFIVRYDAALGSTSLPLHHDTSALSVTLPLTQVGEDYEGGGLLVEALAGTPCGGLLAADAGHATVFAGPLRHGGGLLTRGLRVVLVLFLYVEGFAYGGLLRGEGGEGSSSSSSSSNAPSSEPAAAGAGAAARKDRAYVVYRETLALAEALSLQDEDCRAFEG